MAGYIDHQTSTDAFRGALRDYRDHFAPVFLVAYAVMGSTAAFYSLLIILH